MTTRFDHLTRRRFIQGLGAGAAFASSVLGSKVALGQTETAPVRLLIVPLQHGWGRNREISTFSGTETEFTLPAPLDAFEPVRDQCLFVDGLRGTMWGNAHDVSYSDMLTASVPYGEGDSAQLGAHFPEPMGPSIDWLIANALNVNVLRLSADYGSWGKAYHPLCFNSASREQAFYTTARQAYDAIIDPLRESAGTDDNRGRRAVRDRLFNFLGNDTNRMMRKVSGTERQKLEGYLEAMNDLGNRLSPVSSGGGIDPADLPSRPSRSDDFEYQVDNYLDLIRLAFTADTHRVAVLGLGEHSREFTWTDDMGTERVGNIFGNDFHQEVAHYGANSTARRAFEGWARWYGRKMASFVQDLAQVDDVDGRKLIDNTIIVLTGEVETGQHNTRSKLHTILGGGGGIRRGRWLHLPEVDVRNRQGVFIGGERRDGTRVESDLNYGLPVARHTHADLWVTIANLCGVPIDSFGLGVNNWQPITLT